MDGLMENDLMMTLDDLRIHSLRRRRRWSGLSSRASTSSGSNGFSPNVTTKQTEPKKRGSSQTRRNNNFNSNWKLVGSPYECSIYIDVSSSSCS